MKSLWIVIFVFSFTFAQEKESVNIYRIEKPDRLQIYAKNENIFPVTIEVKFDLENLEPTKYVPFTGVLKPKSNVNIVDLKFIDVSGQWDYESTYKFYMGSIFARHNDNFAYRLPYKKGNEYKLAQGIEGAFTHQGDMRYAFDFDLEFGSEVYAARGGKVVAIEEKNNRGGPLRQYMDYANYITILHDDGTFADYSHLKKDGVEVKIGQDVKMGEVIGYSGDTGYASGPHLHFVVKKTKKGGGYVSIPVRFVTNKGVIELQEGKKYVAH